MRTANSFHVSGDNKYTRFEQYIVFMITGGRIGEKETDEYALRSMKEVLLADLRMSSKMREKRGLVPMGETIEYTSLYGTDLSGNENAESMLKMLVGLPAEVITQGLSKIHEEFSNLFLR